MRLTAKAIFDKKGKGEKIIALTAYDFPFARILDEEGMDVVLVGDSLGMVLLGYESTIPVTMKDMLHHTKAVSRAVRRALLVADMPFGSYDTPEKAVSNAQRFLKEANADAVKLEGGLKIREQLKALIGVGIPVMGHVGMLPQSINEMGGYKVQGKNKAQADKILEDAVLLDELGAFSIVLECIPQTLGARITKEVKCPTIGIGAGPKTDGQVLVLHDLLGFKAPVRPRFVRRYGDIEKEIRLAVSAYREDVLNGKFPSKEEGY